MPPPRHSRSRAAASTEESMSAEEHDASQEEAAMEATDAPPEVPPAEDPVPPTEAPAPAEVPAVPVVTSAPPSAHIMPEAPMPAPPTLHEAFTTLCRAMEPHLADDMPAYQHVQEIQAWYANGPENYRLAWTHAIQLLERVLDIPLTQR